MGMQLDFAITGEQEMIRALVARYAADPAHNWALLAEMGLLSLPFSEENGGMAAGDIEIITAMEEFGRGQTGAEFLPEIILAARLLEQAGTPTHIRQILPPIIAGEKHIALAFAEHGTRFDVAAPQTQLQHSYITGSKTFVPAGADFLIVTASHHAEFALCLVAADAPGLSQNTYQLIDGTRACELNFSATPAQIMPGKLDDLLQIMASARIAACAEMLGLAAKIFESTLDYVRQRKQFGAPIGSFQAIQHRLADLYAGLELARSHLYRCVLVPNRQRAAAIAAAKCYISTLAIRLGEECIQFHGGMGVSDELPIGRAHKRIILLANFLGDAETELQRYNTALRAA